MISSRKELSFFINSDRIMNRGSIKPTIKERVTSIFVPDYTIKYLVAMRKADYYSTLTGVGKLLYVKWLRRFRQLSLKLGYDIEYNVFGYGLVLPHSGTIVVGGSNKIGNYAVLHTSTCIVARDSVIGNGLYLSAGAVISKHVEMGNNITIGVNSVVNRSQEKDNVLLVGAPASVKKDSEAWYIRDGKKYQERMEYVESLRRQMGL